MQCPDVNVLVSAFRADAPHHTLCRRWLEDSLASEEMLAVSELVLRGAACADASEGICAADASAGCARLHPFPAVAFACGAAPGRQFSVARFHAALRTIARDRQPHTRRVPCGDGDRARVRLGDPRPGVRGATWFSFAPSAC